MRRMWRRYGGHRSSLSPLFKGMFVMTLFLKCSSFDGSCTRLVKVVDMCATSCWLGGWTVCIWPNFRARYCFSMSLPNDDLYSAILRCDESLITRISLMGNSTHLQPSLSA